MIGRGTVDVRATVTYAYEPYGASTASGTTSGNSYQYTGRESDGGLYYYRNRYYSPVAQRFVSEDPIGLTGGQNVYAYAGGNPISYRDPLGLFLTSVDAACALDPHFCAEIMGQMVENLGVLTCQESEAKTVADGIRKIGLVASILPIASVARGLPDALNIGSKQFGKKLGKHARELGLDPASAKARYALQRRLERIFENADEVRKGLWRGQGPGGIQGEALFYRRGHDVMVTTLEGDFVTILPGGATNSHFLGASVVP